MKLAKALDDKKLDIRLLDRLLAEGKVTKSELDEYLKNLPDESTNSQPVQSAASAPETTV